MFVGFIGIVIVFFIFDVALPDPTLPSVCLACPETRTCTVCSEGKLDANGTNYVLSGYTDISKGACEQKYTAGVDCPEY